MSTPKRTKTERMRDRRIVAALYLRGMYQADIAARLNAREGITYSLTQPTISRDLTAIRRAWLASSVRDFEQQRAIELAKIDNLEIVYWEAWQRSCDAKTLHGVQWCINRRCVLLGLDAPARLEHSGGGDVVLRVVYEDAQKHEEEEFTEESA